MSELQSVGMTEEMNADEMAAFIKKFRGEEEVFIPRDEDWIVERFLHPSITDGMKKRINKAIKDKDLKDISKENTTCRGNFKQYILDGVIEEDDVDFIKAQVRDIIEKNEILDYKFDLEFSIAWTAIGKKGSFHIPHTHSRDVPVDVLSTTIYLSANETDESDDGYFYHVWREECNGVEYTRPEPGMMLLFPNWLVHGTLPQGSGTRQTLNLSFKVVKR